MTNYTTSFTINKGDLAYMLRQIKIAEATSLAYGSSAPKTILQSIMDEYGVTAANAAQLPAGLRTVDGTFNNLIPGQNNFGAADTLFPRLTTPVFINEGDGDTMSFGPGGPLLTNTNYGVLPDVSSVPGLQPGLGSVADADPRIISNLIVDMSVRNPAAIEAFLNNPLAMEAFVGQTGLAESAAAAWLVNPVNLLAANELMKIIPNQSPDIGLSPGFNSWMTFFGQFFDHGLDLVTKGGNGTVYIPLQPDDPLYSNTPGALNFMVLTRATATIVDGVPQHQNTTTSWIDQNQTYTSAASHQVFLREYIKNSAGDAISTGRLLDGSAATGSLSGSIGNWADVKAQAKDMLGIILTDFDVHNLPLLRTDQYGKFIPGPNGYAQVATATGFVEGTAEGLSLPANTERTNHAFLNDIAHHAAPSIVDVDINGVRDGIKSTVQVGDLDIDVNGNGIYDTGDTLTDVNNDGFVNGADFFADDNNAITYDNEMLNSHFITGDGRGNENIGLTSVHSIFHSEHNRLVAANKATILESGDLAFINEWLLVDIPALPAAGAALVWDGERLFQAAKFTTEMQYQHLVFEEFARRIQPMVDPFIFNSSTEINPAIVAEFAHTVYRFGHSMLTGTVDRLENNLTTVNGETSQASLIAAFLNPQMYIASGQTAEQANANLIRGLSRDVGNEIDEFIVSDVRSNLLGLPLDLAALNIARGRETGIPSLNETRAQLYNGGAIDLKPYASWVDFSQHIKNPLSIINFIAAYGTHTSILAETTTAGMRTAAENLVNLAIANDPDALDFLNATGTYATDVELGGLNNVDLWIGGLAEAKNEFGGMLGQTFNYIFEFQMEQLQFGDRMYYLTRTQGLNILNQLEPNTFSDLVMRNTDLGNIYSTHLNGALFVTPDHIFEMDRGIAQEDYNDASASLDPTWAVGEPHSALQSKVTRTITGVTELDTTTGIWHDVGGTFKFLGGEHVVVGGTEGNDRIYTDKGIDTLWGDGGNDYLNAGTESDDVFGGDGDDIIEDPFGDDVLRGNAGNDVIATARGADLVFGDDGNDFLMLGQDASEIFGGLGDDFILGGDGKDFLLGNEGNDWMEGGKGFDTMAGDNSELFFNSLVVGHDVMFNQGDEGDYDAESGDDIMGSGPSVFRYEGMFGFDWAIAKHDITGVSFDMAIPVFTTTPNDILKDRFDQTEALSGWKFDDILSGDDRGHKGGGSSAPDSVPTELFNDHILTAEGIARIDGFAEWFDGARTTLFGSVPGANPIQYRDGNILLGGDGNDFFRGRGGYDLIDGDAWLNVRIKIVVNGVTYSAESLNSDTTVMGQYAGKVFNTDANGDAVFTSPAFGGRSITSLMLDGTINPGMLSIIREIKYDETPSNNIDTAFFQGTFAEYDIEGRGRQFDLNSDGDYLDVGEEAQLAFDVNGDGFISVRDRDTGAVGAVVNGVQLSSRGLLTDDLDLLKNIEQLQFADRNIVISGTNNQASGLVTILDPTPFAGEVTPYVGQVLVPVLSNFADLDGIPIDSATGLPVGLKFEWQTTEVGNNAGWSTIIINDGPYTVRSVDPGHVLRAVATFVDSNGITERIYSAPTGNPTVALNVNENSPTNTVVLASIPFSVDYDSLSQNGLPPVDVDITTLHHQIDPAHTADGRFTVVQNGFNANGNPLYQVLVANGGPTMLDYEVQDPSQTVDNQYQIVINSYSNTPALGGLLLASRQFTIFLNDVVNEGGPTNITWNGVHPLNSDLPLTGEIIANLASTDSDQATGHIYALMAGSTAGFAVSATGEVTTTSQITINSTSLLNVRSTDSSGASKTETFTIRIGQNGIDNVITGVVTDDIMYGMSGQDALSGGVGDDQLFGQAGNDTLDGGIGNDRLDGGSGDDLLNGGIGTDTAIFTTAASGATFSFAAGNLQVNDGGIGTDTLIDIELLQFTDGTYSVQAGTNGNDILLATFAPEIFVGLGGTDTVSYANSLVGVTANLASNTSTQGDVFNSIENLTSSAQIDNLTGNNGDNVLAGGGGNDVLNGAGGNDTLDGGTGADNMTGGAGNDTYIVDNAGDVVNEATGGAGGTDTVQSSVSITALATNVENLTLTGSAAIDGTGNSGSNIITGNGADNILNAGSGGIDVLTGGAGNDTYVVHGGFVVVNEAAGAGTDTIQTSSSLTTFLGLAGNVENLTLTGTGNISGNGNGLDNVIVGNTGNNVLSGGSGADTINGGGGTDIITGGAGQDTMTGGAGKDRFVFGPNITDSGTTAATQDVITDYAAVIPNTMAGSDTIVLSAIDANTATAANDVFTFIGTGAFTAAGQIRYVQVGGNTFVEGNVDGGLGADFSIQLSGLKTLGASDFVL